MWRLWTKGWGPRDWWYWFKNESFPMFIVWKLLPPRVVYWAYIRVMALSGDNPDAVSFKRASDDWCSKYQIH